MKTTTIKTTIDCDYLVYFDQDLNVVGYELSPDERKALSARYHSSEEANPIMPLKTTYILEVFGIFTTMVWLVDNASKNGQLLFYKPSTPAFSKEITKTMDEALLIEDYVGTGNTATDKSKQLPVLTEAISKDPIPLENILKSLPFTGWLEYYWGTPTWQEIWKARPDLQHLMVNFAKKKREQKEGNL